MVDDEAPEDLLLDETDKASLFASRLLRQERRSDRSIFPCKPENERWYEMEFLEWTEDVSEFLRVVDEFGFDPAMESGGRSSVA